MYNNLCSFNHNSSLCKIIILYIQNYLTSASTLFTTAMEINISKSVWVGVSSSVPILPRHLRRRPPPHTLIFTGSLGVDQSWTWVGSIHGSGWVGLGRVQSQNYLINTQFTRKKRLWFIMMRSFNIVIYYRLIKYSNIKAVLFGQKAVALETMMLASEL